MALFDDLSTIFGAYATKINSLKSNLGALDDRVDALESGGSGSGLTEDIKSALMNLVNHLVWDDDDPTGQTYITALYNALYPPAELVSISAVYTQSGAIYESNTLDDLKDDLVVTALMSDQTTRPVTDYTLSGTLTEGTSTITVSYGGKTATFNVTVSHEAVSTKLVTTAGTYVTSKRYAYSPNESEIGTWTYDVYSIADVKAGDIINLVIGWNEANYTNHERKYIATSSGTKPDMTSGTFVKHSTSYGEVPVTINQDYDLLYIGIINTNSGGYMQYCTWTREGGF